MLLKNTIQILLNKYEKPVEEEAQERLKSQSYFYKRIIATGIEKNISYAHTLPTVLFLKDSVARKELFKYVGPGVWSKRFART